jgi:hypothetical protein
MNVGEVCLCQFAKQQSFGVEGEPASQAVGLWANLIWSALADDVRTFLMMAAAQGRVFNSLRFELRRLLEMSVIGYNVTILWAEVLCS